MRCILALAIVIAGAVFGPAYASYNFDVLATRWEPTNLSVSECTSRGSVAIKEAGFTNNKTEGETSFADDGQSLFMVRCLTGKGVVFCIGSGNNTEAMNNQLNTVCGRASGRIR